MFQNCFINSVFPGYMKFLEEAPHWGAALIRGRCLIEGGAFSS